MKSSHQIKLGKFVSSLPVHAGYCADCLSELYDEPIDDVGAYLRETGILSYPGHCRHCGEHKDTFHAHGIRPSLTRGPS
jgi:hypothetical protein